MELTEVFGDRMIENTHILELYSYMLLILYNVILNNINFKNIRALDLQWGKSSLQCPFKGLKLIFSAMKVLTSAARE